MSDWSHWVQEFSGLNGDRLVDPAALYLEPARCEEGAAPKGE